MNKPHPQPYTRSQGKFGFLGTRGHLRTETDSETEELCNRPPPRVSRLESLVDLVESTMRPESRPCLVASYQRCSETRILKAMLLVWQLLWQALVWLCGETVGLGEVFGSWRLRLWNGMSRLRNSLRQLLLRHMVNFLNDLNETLVFCTVALIAPCLFCLSLLGFIWAVGVLLKKAVGQLLFQISP